MGGFPFPSYSYRMASDEKVTTASVHARADATMRKNLPENKKPSGKLISFEVSVADNGYTMDVRYEPPKSEKSTKDSCCSVPWEPPKKKVFETKESLSDAIGALL